MHVTVDQNFRSPVLHDHVTSLWLGSRCRCLSTRLEAQQVSFFKKKKKKRSASERQATHSFRTQKLHMQGSTLFLRSKLYCFFFCLSSWLRGARVKLCPVAILSCPGAATRRSRSNAPHDFHAISSCDGKASGPPH